MRVESDYRGFRIEVTAVEDGNAWNVEVRITRTGTGREPHAELVKYRLSTADDAERRGGIYARRWVDRLGADRA